MSLQIPTAFVKQFEAAVQHLVQQKGSRLRGSVTIRSGLVGESAFLDQLGKSTSSEKTGRHEPIVFSDTPHARRRVTSSFIDTADAIDGDDKMKIIIGNPSGEYALAQANELGRQIDTKIIEAATGTAFTGKEGATSVVLPSSQKVAVDFVELGGATDTNMTLAKLRETAEIMTANEVDDEDRFGALNASMIHSLLFDNRLTDADHNAVKPLVTGKIVSFMGFTLIPSQRLLGTATSRKAIFWHRKGIHFGIWKDIGTDITDRNDLRAKPTQIYTSMQIGATRMEEEMIVEVACNENVDLVST